MVNVGEAFDVGAQEVHARARAHAGADEAHGKRREPVMVDQVVAGETPIGRAVIICAVVGAVAARPARRREAVVEFRDKQLAAVV